jgi:hypothetical protein
VLRLVTDRFDPPALDTAVSAAVLHRVAAGLEPPTLRLWTPERSVAFGRQDRGRPGYGDAVAAVAALGFAPVERLAGGRAAVFHEGTIAFSWAMPEPHGLRPSPHASPSPASWLSPGEPRTRRPHRRGPRRVLPGEWSVNLGGAQGDGRGQRLIRGGAHVGGVIVVTLTW